MTVTLSGCAGNRYHVDYHGQKDFFKGAKDSYAAGQRVVLKYDLIATDTDYSFSVIGYTDIAHSPGTDLYGEKRFASLVHEVCRKAIRSLLRQVFWLIFGAYC